EGNALVGECLFISLETVDIDVAFRGSRDMDDAAAALADQMGSGLVRRPLVVDLDADAAGKVGGTVEKDHRDLFLKEGFEVGEGVGVIGQGNEQAIHSTIE